MLPLEVRRAVLAVVLLPLGGAALAERPPDATLWLPRAAAPQAAPPVMVLPDGVGPRESEAVQSPLDLWLDEALRLVVRYQQNPLRAARVLALLHVAMADAAVLAGTSGEAQAALAVHRAAGLVLGYLHPQESPGELEARSMVEIARWARRGPLSPPAIAQALEAGERAAAAALARARGDGAQRIPTLPPALPAGLDRWRPAPPLLGSAPLEPLAGAWRTWVLASPAEIAVPPPPRAGSAAFDREVREVLAVARALTAAQKRIAEDWNLDRGSVTPAGVWNLRAREFATAAGLEWRAQLRLRAAMNVAIMDAYIATWRVKYDWLSARPITVIRDTLDPGFEPHLPTPGFPGYVGGHAAVSGAAATVLAASLPGARDELLRQAAEAARSRLYGGIHFASDNDEGLRLGRRVGERVLGWIALPQARP